MGPIETCGTGCYCVGRDVMWWEGVGRDVMWWDALGQGRKRRKKYLPLLQSTNPH